MLATHVCPAEHYRSLLNDIMVSASSLYISGSEDQNYLQRSQGLCHFINACDSFLVLCAHSDISGSGPGPITLLLVSSVRAQAMSCTT